jgi:DNA-binding response OmpR family regulator
MARVLVVDDEPDLRELLRVSLALAGHEVTVASDGKKGLDLVRERAPDVVVLDVMMPGLDGWSVLCAMKADASPKVALVPVVMLTARSDELDLVRGGIEGAVRYLTKPFSISDLRSAIDESLSAGPEPEQRRAAQHAALVQLARLQKGEPAPARPPAQPRLSRLEPVGGLRSARQGRRQQGLLPAWLKGERLTGREREVLEAVVGSPTLTEARLRLEISRSYLYASLRRMAGKLGFESGRALVQALRAAGPWGQR